MKSIERRSLILMRWYEEQINKENTKIKIILPTTHVQKQRRKDFVTLIDSFLSITTTLLSAFNKIIIYT